MAPRRRHGVGQPGGGYATDDTASRLVALRAAALQNRALALEGQGTNAPIGSNAPAKGVPPSPAPPAMVGAAPAPALAKTSKFTAAMAVASDPAKLEAAVEALQRDKFARTSNRPRETWWTTWARFHQEAMPHIPVLPLTAHVINVVSALFKVGQYVSFHNYAQRAKTEHMGTVSAHGVPWSVELERCLKDCTRSVLRGLGAAQQSLPLDPLPIPALRLGDAAIAVGGPAGPGRFLVAGAFFMCREVEIANADFAHVTVGQDRRSVTWCLPASKTDIRGLGTSRTWGCICGGNTGIACPVHALLQQMDWCAVMADANKWNLDSLPLFPTATGSRIKKEAAVAPSAAAASRLGLRTSTAQGGGQLFGGHS